MEQMKSDRVQYPPLLIYVTIIKHLPFQGASNLAYDMNFDGSWCVSPSISLTVEETL